MAKRNVTNNLFGNMSPEGISQLECMAFQSDMGLILLRAEHRGLRGDKFWDAVDKVAVKNGSRAKECFVATMKAIRHAVTGEVEDHQVVEFAREAIKNAPEHFGGASA